MASQTPGFQGALESAIDVPSGDKILGIADEFFDLGSRYQPKKKISFWFNTKAEATIFLQRARSATPWVLWSSTKKEAPRDWMRAWRKHYRPLYFSVAKKKIAVIPAWEKLTPSARKANAIIRIHPGQAFGAGSHETTKLCLEALLRLNFKADAKLERAKWLSVLDFGAGTGILGIALDKLLRKEGVATKIDFVEIDAAALSCLAKNLKRNRCVGKISRKVPAKKKYDLIVANVLSPALLANRELLLGRLKSPGYLILSGILAEDEAPFLKSFFGKKGSLAHVSRAKDWIAFTYSNASA